MSKPKMPHIRVKRSPRTGEYLATVPTVTGEAILGTGYTRGAARRQALHWLHGVLPK